MEICKVGIERVGMAEDSDLAIPSLVEFGLTPLQARVFVVVLASDGLSTSEILQDDGCSSQRHLSSFEEIIATRFSGDERWKPVEVLCH